MLDLPVSSPEHVKKEETPKSLPEKSTVENLQSHIEMIHSPRPSDSSFRFSVLIPVYGKDDPGHFYQALQSLQAQSLPPDEILIVKDGPLTEALENTVLRFKESYPGTCRVLGLETNMGLARALNEGLKRCTYEWVARMDGDDICHPQRFEKQVAFLARHPDVQVLGSHIEEFAHTMHDLGVFRKIPSTHEQIVKWSRLRCPINHMTVMYQKQRVLDAGGYETAFGTFEDYPLWVKLLQQGAKFHNLPEVLVHVRVKELDMIHRRRGLKYAGKEWRLANYFFRIRHINLRQYAIWVFLRVPARLIPARLLRMIYLKTLRKSK